MSQGIELKAATRKEVGKANRHLAGRNLLPAVVYGVNHTPQAIAVDRHAFEQLMLHEGLTSTVIKLSVDDHKAVNVIVKAIQRDAVRGSVQHVDFWAVRMNQTISTTVPIHFIGESAGVKTGGVLTHNLRELHIDALPGDMPEYVDADVSALEVGDALHVSDLTVPENVVVTTALDEIVCSVLAPKVEEVEEVEEEAEAAEPEVIGAKPEEATGE
jgi:large subunit ribosomal protein L25